MLLSAEQWRKDENVDELVRCVFFSPFVIRHTSAVLNLSLYVAPRTFEFKEKEEVDKYYPQYYHKIDKVCRSVRVSPKRKDSLLIFAS